MGGPFQSQARRTDSAPALDSAREVAPLTEFVSAMETLRALSATDSATVREISRNLRNCCGQYALTTVCREHGLDISLDTAVAGTNPLGIFTGPYEVTGFLRKNGIHATEHNRGTEEALFRHVSDGKLALLVVDSKDEEGRSCPHWVVVSGVTTDESGRRTWNISDSAGMSGSETFVGQISNEALMEAWQTPLRGIGRLAGFRNYWIGVDEKPGLFSRPLTTAVASSGAHLVNQAAKCAARTADASRDFLDRLTSLRFPARR